MRKNNLVVPVVKWVGGKRQLLSALTPLLPERISPYCEPFLGGGAMLFSQQPSHAAVNDINSELIHMYETVRDDVDGLIHALEQHRNEAEYFYQIRNSDRDKTAYTALPAVEKAARIIYLNKTCYNGLFRVNRAGEFNVPFGRYKNPNIVNAHVLRAVSQYLNRADVIFSCRDYAEVLAELPGGSFVYLDPPYDPISGTSNFTSYSRDGFTRKDQIRLRECCDDLNRRGIRFMLSNSATPFILEQYSAYDIKIVKARRPVNSAASGRGHIDEIVVRNYSDHSGFSR